MGNNGISLYLLFLFMCKSSLSPCACHIFIGGTTFYMYLAYHHMYLACHHVTRVTM